MANINLLALGWSSLLAVAIMVAAHVAGKDTPAPWNHALGMVGILMALAMYAGLTGDTEPLTVTLALTVAAGATVLTCYGADALISRLHELRDLRNLNPKE